jgi:Zn-dependent protease with chaperone function/uncharacterized tellurite resistance protein B-like protein
MNPEKSFFEHQQLARRNTRIMVVLFLLAVVAVVLSVVAVLAVLYAGSHGDFTRAGPPVPWAERLRQVPASVYLWGTLLTAGLIFAVSAINVARLAGGGPAVARMVGARAVAPDTGDPLERRLVNVVEEMAIASGVRVPAVYVMDGERGINAFAAGWDVSGAVVAVTRGTLETLTRDELQGVVAHEFSHILNGDMRLNIRLLGVLAGIVFIGAIGEFVIRSARGSRDKGSYFWLAGLALFVIGYVGLFFARLIKSAVSREREFLADASSVQFTRNPDGIAGALDQIGLASEGALVRSRYAEDLSHMFFGQSVRARLGGLFDTHPPLGERIRRVHPRFDAAHYREARAAAVRPVAAPAGLAASREGRRAGDLGTAWGRSAAESMGLVGTLDAGDVDYAARVLEALPAALREELRQPAGAAAVTVALLLSPAEEVMAQQLAAIGAAPLAAEARRLAVQASLLGPAFHLPVVDLALEVLKTAPEADRRALIQALEGVVHADRRVSAHEFVVLTLVRSQLGAPARGPAAEGRRLAELREEARLVTALMDPHHARPSVTLAQVEQALEKLKSLRPLEKARLVQELFAAATADGKIRVAEAELMRLVGAVLNCPLPPLLRELDPENRGQSPIS